MIRLIMAAMNVTFAFTLDHKPALLELPKFKTALECRDRFTFGIEDGSNN
jgi:hypothetical protein